MGKTKLSVANKATAGKSVCNKATVNANQKLPKNAKHTGLNSSDSKNKQKIFVNEQSNLNHELQSANEKPKSLVAELKLFQNNQLLNQQDPVQQLQLQLSKIITGDNHSSSSKRSHPTRSGIGANDCHSDGRACRRDDCLDADAVMNCPLTQETRNQSIDNQRRPPNDCHNSDNRNPQNSDNALFHLDGSENTHTIKKGVLWEQYNHERLHRRLFCRWKKRYFILTTDYLVCFKKSSPRVGHSEMGKFVHKTSLNDVTNVDWVRPKKSDKGPIVLGLASGQFDLLLWTKEEGLDDWMFVIKESVARHKFRRSNQGLLDEYKQEKVNKNQDVGCISNQKDRLGGNENPNIYDNTIASVGLDEILPETHIINESSEGNHKPSIPRSATFEKPRPSAETVQSDTSKFGEHPSQPNELAESLSSHKLEQSGSNERRPSMVQIGEIVGTEKTPPNEANRENAHELAHERDSSGRTGNSSSSASGTNDDDMHKEKQRQIPCQNSNNKQPEVADAIFGDSRRISAIVSGSSKQTSGHQDDLSSRPAHARVAADIRASSSDGEASALVDNDNDKRLAAVEPVIHDVATHTEPARVDGVKSAVKDANSGNGSGRRGESSASSAASRSLGGRGSDDQNSLENGASDRSNQRRRGSSSATSSSISSTSGRRSSRETAADLESGAPVARLPDVLTSSVRVGAHKQCPSDGFKSIDSAGTSSSPQSSSSSPSSPTRKLNGNEPSQIESEEDSCNIKILDSRLVSNKSQLLQQRQDREVMDVRSMSENYPCDTKISTTSNSGCDTGKRARQTIEQSRGRDIAVNNYQDSQGVRANRHLNCSRRDQRVELNGERVELAMERSHNDNWDNNGNTNNNNNMIRRDESWQSLVSLTRIGATDLNQTGREMQPNELVGVPSTPIVAAKMGRAGHLVDQRHLHAAGSGPIHRLGPIDIESAVTPLRAPPMLRQSPSAMLFDSQASGHQAGGLRRRAHGRPPLPGLARGVVSFEGAPSMSQAVAASNVSYRQKLLQLQLLHNSQNVDYIRSNLEAGSSKLQSHANNRQLEQPVYGGPDSNYYGYSSMRSNLKSVTSEFAFIRPPNSRLPYPNQHRPLLIQQREHHQSTLPRQPSAATRSSYQLMVAAGGGGVDASMVTGDTPKRSSMILVQDGGINTGINQSPRPFLIHPVTGNRIVSPVPQQNIAGGAVDMVMGPPLRELPLKPNKRRILNETGGSHLPKSSSLTSSIASFFRRAFSRRSKKCSSKRQRSRLAESCSSSLGAFDDAHFVGAPSAFSTGSKSVAAANHRLDSSLTNQLLSQEQILLTNQASNMEPVGPRMVDMIEAFASATLAAETRPPSSIGHNPMVPPSEPASRLTGVHLGGGGVSRPFGVSPLHKSNSICATSGAALAESYHRHLATTGGVNPRDSPFRDHRHSALISQQLQQHQMELVNERQLVTGAHEEPLVQRQGSPLVGRAAKVLSANLTPTMTQRQQHYWQDSPAHVQQLFMSPRMSAGVTQQNGAKLPRPSSIYGQPSMIGTPQRHHPNPHQHNTQIQPGFSSPVTSRDDKVFGLHRNSIHGHHNLGQQQTERPMEPLSAGVSDRLDHHESMVSPSSYGPSSGSRRHQYFSSRVSNLDPTAELAEESSATPRRLQHHGSMVDSRDTRMQPELDTPLSRVRGQPYWQAVVNPILQSPTMDTIYDNHPMLLRPNRSPSPNNSMNINENLVHTFYDNSAPHHNQQQQQQQQQHYRSRLGHSLDQDLEFRQSFIGPSATTVNEMMRSNLKPSAVVAPSTPNRNDSFQERALSLDIDQQQSQFLGRSPVLPRRNNTSQGSSQYQQSPLVSSKTRVFNRAGGIQTTVTMNQDLPANLTQRADSADDSPETYQRATVNIACAPGINLEPSLAAYLLQGTNLEAFEVSTIDRKSKLSSSSSFSSHHKNRALPRLPDQSADSITSSAIISDSALVTTPQNTNASMAATSREELSSSGSRSMGGSSQGEGSSSNLKNTEALRHLTSLQGC